MASSSIFDPRFSFVLVADSGRAGGRLALGMSPQPTTVGGFCFEAPIFFPEVTMMYSVLLIALWGIAPSVRENPAWITDYGQAKKLSQMERKPIVIFFGSGVSGWNDISRQGRLEPDAGRLLAKSYVCLYLDTAS